MKRRHKRRGRCRQTSAPLTASLADRLGLGVLSAISPPPAPPQMPRMPSPPRSARDVLTLLTAATGLTLAAQPSAELELLPGSPTTVLITSGGKAQAAFVLPVPHEVVCRAMGHPIPQGIDQALNRLWEEERHAG